MLTSPNVTSQSMMAKARINDELGSGRASIMGWAVGGRARGAI